MKLPRQYEEGRMGGEGKRLRRPEKTESGENQHQSEFFSPNRPRLDGE